MMKTPFAMLLLISSAIASDANAETTAVLTDDDSTYCTQAGGTVEQMPAVFSTQTGLVTGLTQSFCTFHVDNGFIVIGLKSFSSESANIAATYMKTLPEITGDSALLKGKYSNPSFNVCLNLGGTTMGFVSGGGFTNDLGESDVCVFGDGSMVSGWSLIYMASHREGYDHVKNQVKAEPMAIAMPGA